MVVADAIGEEGHFFKRTDASITAKRDEARSGRSVHHVPLASDIERTQRKGGPSW